MESQREPEDSEFKRFCEQQGIRSPADMLVDDEPPEPVNVDKLRAFHRRELSGPDMEWVGFLISRYRAWHEADMRILEDQQGGQSTGNQPVE